MQLCLIDFGCLLSDISRLESVAASLFFFQMFLCVGLYSLLRATIFPMLVFVCRFSLIAFIEADSMSAIDFSLSHDAFSSIVCRRYHLSNMYLFFLVSILFVSLVAPTGIWGTFSLSYVSSVAILWRKGPPPSPPPLPPSVNVMRVLQPSQ